MQRFGRTAQTKMKDGWGGSFILAAILALALAYWAGNAISQKFGGADTVGSSLPGLTGTVPKTGASGNAAFEPRQYELYFVQVGAFLSESKAKGLAYTLSDHSYPAMVAAPDSKNLNRVYAGVYTSRESADAAKSKLAAEGITAEAPIIKDVTVEHNPDAIPALATASKPADVRSGLDAINTYLYEAAVFVEGRAAGGTTDTTHITGLAQKLNNLATGMAVDKDPLVKQFAVVAANAAVNARDLETAASAAITSEEYQKAMKGYLSLLEQYGSMQSPTK